MTAAQHVYIGTDAVDIAGLPLADHVAKWDGLNWSAVGANNAGDNGWFSTTTVINALAGTGSYLFATGTFLNANGDARADNVAFFDGTAWIAPATSTPRRRSSASRSPSARSREPGGVPRRERDCREDFG